MRKSLGNPMVKSVFFYLSSKRSYGQKTQGWGPVLKAALVKFCLWTKQGLHYMELSCHWHWFWHWIWHPFGSCLDRYRLDRRPLKRCRFKRCDLKRRPLKRHPMIAETQRSIIFKSQRNWTIDSIDRKIEATIKDICIFRGHMVVLGALNLVVGPKFSKILGYLK